jgi:hypothetical protein
MLVDRQPRQKGADLACSHVTRMTAAVEDDESPDPVQIGFLRTAAVVPRAYLHSNPVE